SRAEEHPLLPLDAQERADVAPHALPEIRVVRLEDHPLSAALDRLLQVVKQPADVQVTPGWVSGERARAPHDAPATVELADAIDADRVELPMLTVHDRILHPERAAYHLVRRGLVDSVLLVTARPDARHMPARGHIDRRLRERIGDLDPGIVQRAVL